MKFFTEEWYHDTLISQMCFSIRKSNRAQALSDKFFEKLYSSESEWYAKHLKRAAKFNRSAFDKEAAKAEFDKNYEDNLEFVKTLPDEILSEIADIRVFALGTVSYEVADKLTSYCGKLNRKCQSIQENYDDSLESVAQIISWTPINMLNMISEAEIVSADSENGATIIKTSECKITLGGCNGSNCLVGARIIAFELTTSDEDKKLCLGLLLEDAEGKLFDESLYFDSISVEEIG